MNNQDLEAIVRRLWSETSVPLTTPYLQSVTGLPRKSVEFGMRQLLRSGVVDMQMDDSGSLHWSLPVERGLAVRSDAQVLAKPAAQVRLGRSGLKVTLHADPNRKSVLLSAGMGLLFGPFGWLYAAPFIEALAAMAVYVALGLLLPRFLLGTLFALIHPTCGVLAMLYAWRFNQTKTRTAILFAGPSRSST